MANQQANIGIFNLILAIFVLSPTSFWFRSSSSSITFLVAAQTITPPPRVLEDNDFGQLEFNDSNQQVSESGTIRDNTVIWFKFELTNTAAVDGFRPYLEISTSVGSPENLDSEIGLYDDSGNLIATNNFSGIGARSTLSFGAGSLNTDIGRSVGQNGPVPGAGVYYVALSQFDTLFGSENFDVSGGSNSQSRDYMLSVYTGTRDIGPPDVGDNDFGQLEFNDSNQQVSESGTIPDNIVIWFKFELTNTATVDGLLPYLDISTSVGSPENLNSVIGLYDDSGNRIAIDFNGGIGPRSTLSFGAGSLNADIGRSVGEDGPVPGAGVYYVALGPFDSSFGSENFAVIGGSGSESGDYVLSVYTGTRDIGPPDVGDNDFGQLEFNDSNQQVSVSGTIPDNIVIWFKFELTNTATVDGLLPYLDISTSVGSPENLNSEIGLYDDSGNRIAINFNGGIGPRSTLSFGAGSLNADIGFPEGQDGSVPGVGVYYVALSQFDSSFGSENFAVSGGSRSESGDYVLSVYTGTRDIGPPDVGDNDFGQLEFNDSNQQVSVSGTIPDNIVIWFKFELTNTATVDGLLPYLDISTSVGSPENLNSEIGLYDDSGNRIAINVNGGIGRRSTLTFGAGSLNADIGFSEGQDGSVPGVGVYYVALCQSGAFFGSENFAVIGGSGSESGDYVLSVYTGTRDTEPPTPTCFSEANTVIVRGKGQISMDRLEIGDFVQTDALHPNIFSPVYTFMHRDPVSRTDFVQIHHDKSTTPLEISSAHMLLAVTSATTTSAASVVAAATGGNGHSIFRFVKAGDIRVGDHVSVTKSSPASPIATVESIRMVSRRGLYAPVTERGTIVVSGVESSCYVAILDHIPGSIQHYGTHVAFGGKRAWCKMTGYCEKDNHSETYDEEGISGYTLFLMSIGLPVATWTKSYQIMAVMAIVPVYAVVAALELIFFSGISSLFLMMIIAAVLLYGRRRHGSSMPFEKVKLT